MSTDTRADQRQVGGSHYASKTVQPWAAMEAWMSPEQFAGFLRGNVIKYLARCDDKGGIEDLKKARHYLDKLIEIGADSQQAPRASPDRLQQLETAAEFAFGCLWMIASERSKRAYAAKKALVALLDTEGKKRGIEAAIDAGFEADHPAGCDWWAGKKDPCEPS